MRSCTTCPFRLGETPSLETALAALRHCDQCLLETDPQQTQLGIVVSLLRSAGRALRDARTDIRKIDQEKCEFERGTELLEERISKLERVHRVASHELETALERQTLMQDLLVQSEKLASMGRLTMGIAHELKNPLNFVVNFAKLQVGLVDELAQMLAESQSGSGVEMDGYEELLTNIKETSTDIREHGLRANDIVQSMMRHAAGMTGQRQSTNLHTLLDEAIALAIHAPRAAKLGVSITIARDYDPVIGDMNLLSKDLLRAFINLLDNAIDAVTSRHQNTTQGAGFGIHVRTRKENNTVVIRMRDSGIGIPPKDLQHIFEPFFTSKPPGSGIGLGLSLTYDIIVKAHRGSITCESVEHEGTTFTIILPT